MVVGRSGSALRRHGHHVGIFTPTAEGCSAAEEKEATTRYGDIPRTRRPTCSTCLPDMNPGTIQFFRPVLRGHISKQHTVEGEE